MQSQLPTRNLCSDQKIKTSKLSTLRVASIIECCTSQRTRLNNSDVIGYIYEAIEESANPRPFPDYKITLECSQDQNWC